MQLSDGVVCTFFQGATGAVNGLRVNYGCEDKSEIIGDPAAGTIWTASQVSVGGSLPPPGTPVPVSQVRIAKVWQ